MDFVLLTAAWTVGIVFGLVIALAIVFRKKKVPSPVPVDKLDAWNHLENLAKEKAETLAKKKVLQESFKKGEIDEKTYVEEDAKLDSILDGIEREMEETMYMIARGLVPDFMVDAKRELVKLEEAIKLANAYKKLKEEVEKVKSERDSLYVKLNNMEDEKKELKAKYNWLEENSNKALSEAKEKIHELESELTRLRGENETLKEELGEAAKPESEKTKNLRNENKLLRENLEKMKTRLDMAEKEINILLSMAERYSKHIKERETKTVEELKSLIRPEEQVVKDLVKTYNDPISAYQYVRDHINEVYLPITTPFWMDLDDVIKIGAGEQDDRAMLLCSMLRALGLDASVVFVETTKGENRALVLLNQDGTYYLLDLEKGRRFDDFVGKGEDEVIKKYSTRHGGISKVLYKVNDKMAKMY